MILLSDNYTNNHSSDNENDINQIIAEFADLKEGSSFNASSLREMAGRYGVDSQLNTPLSEDIYPSDGYAYDYSFGNRPQKKSDNAPVFINGQRVVFDADIEAQKAKSTKGGDSSAGSVRVIYDADTSAKTAYEAPFEDFGELRDEEEDERKKSSKKPKKEKLQKEKELSKGKRILKVFTPWRGDSRAEKIRKIVMDVSFIVLMISTVFVVNYFIELSSAIKLQRDTANSVKPPVTSVDDSADIEAEKWAELKAKYPGVDFPEGLLLQFAELYAKNSDFAGWLSIDNTNIDTPVVQRTSDSTNTYYLKRNFYKEDTKYGCPFLDYRNHLRVLDQNTVIYGHHMKDGLLFAQLENYMTLDGYKKSPLITYSTPYGTYYWKVCSVFISNGHARDDNNYLFNYIAPYFASDEIFQGYIDGIKERSLYDLGVDMKVTDKFLTLSTCSYEFDNARLVVVARLVRPGESTGVDTSKAQVNENPRYPQIWYDIKGKSNPYRDADRWNPYA